MKRPISATIEEKLVKWIKEVCSENTKYRNKSHLIEIALEKLKNQEEK
jgi:Arc/MetJ-type ribon-helix-helix transcriptional regulator